MEKIVTETIELRTGSRDQMLDITEHVNRVVADSGVVEGLAVVHIPHTTAGVTVNENADPDVVTDMLAALNVAVPRAQGFYRHGEGNSAAHVKSTMTGCGLTLLIHRGRPLLGTWQAVWFCEFDGPRTRRAVIRVQGHTRQDE